MNKKEFIQIVQQKADLPDETTAEEGAQIVLSLLSHRLTADEAKDVAAQLPDELKELWKSDTWITNHMTISANKEQILKYKKREELFSLVDNEIKRRLLPARAEPLVNAVFATLKEQISEGEQFDILSQLPIDLKQLWAEA